MKPLVRANIEVRPSPIHGFGVFATSAMPANTLLEECYVLNVPYDTTLLRSYLFKLNDKTCVVPLGCGAIYNHASEPNASYVLDAARQVMCVTSKRALAKGEEIFISYGEKWFSSRQLTPKQMGLFYRSWRWLRHSAAPRFGLIALVLFMVWGHVST